LSNAQFISDIQNSIKLESFPKFALFGFAEDDVENVLVVCRHDFLTKDRCDRAK